MDVRTNGPCSKSGYWGGEKIKCAEDEKQKKNQHKRCRNENLGKEVERKEKIKDLNG